MAALIHSTKVIPISGRHRRIAARTHHKIIVSPGSRKVVPISRLKQARRDARRVRRMENGSAALLLAASITAALAIARFYLAKSNLSPAVGMPTTW